MNSAKYSRRGMQCLRDAGAAIVAQERARLLEASQRWFDLAIRERDLDEPAASPRPVVGAPDSRGPAAGRDQFGKTSH